MDVQVTMIVIHYQVNQLVYGNLSIRISNGHINVVVVKMMINVSIILMGHIVIPNLLLFVVGYHGFCG